MKHIFLPLLTLLACGPMTVACGQSGPQGDTDELATVLHQCYRDSTGVEFKFEADIPVSGPQPLTDSIRVALLNTGDSTLNVLQTAPQKIIARMADSFLMEQVSDIASLKKDFPDSEYRASYTSSVRLHDNQPGYVTYTSEGYEYSPGAAHGMPWQGGYTFERATGKRLQWDDIFTAQGKERLKSILCNAIAEQWYWQSGQTDEFKKRGTIELPGEPPLLTAGGVVFFYQAYEIGSYAEGMPKCTLPYSDLLPLMTARAAALVREK